MPEEFNVPFEAAGRGVPADTRHIDRENEIELRNLDALLKKAVFSGTEKTAGNRLEPHFFANLAPDRGDGTFTGLNMAAR